MDPIALVHRRIGEFGGDLGFVVYDEEREGVGGIGHARTLMRAGRAANFIAMVNGWWVQQVTSPRRVIRAEF
jgi:hypothetical protein